MGNCHETIHVHAANRHVMLIAIAVAAVELTMAVTMAATETTAIAVMTGTTGIETVIGTVIEIGTVTATGIVTETATGIEIAGAQTRGLGHARVIGEMTAEDVMTGEGPSTRSLMTRMTEIGTETGTGTKIDEPLMMALGALRKVLLQATLQNSHGRGARSNGEEGSSSHTHQRIRNHTNSLMDKRLVSGMGSSQPFQHGILSNGLGHPRLLPRGSGRRRLNNGPQQHLISNGHNIRPSHGDREKIFIGKVEKRVRIVSRRLTEASDGTQTA